MYVHLKKKIKKIHPEKKKKVCPFKSKPSVLIELRTPSPQS